MMNVDKNGEKQQQTKEENFTENLMSKKYSKSFRILEIQLDICWYKIFLYAFISLYLTFFKINVLMLQIQADFTKFYKTTDLFMKNWPIAATKIIKLAKSKTSGDKEMK